jgi:hypothetical protein
MMIIWPCLFLLFCPCIGAEIFLGKISLEHNIKYLPEIMFPVIVKAGEISKYFKCV